MHETTSHKICEAKPDRAEKNKNINPHLHFQISTFLSQKLIKLGNQQGYGKTKKKKKKKNSKTPSANKI